ncbi:hypothetical protein A2U01_0070037, partial [Trifolium medium]|nr:hypothetical protein [Trifolium medium]
ELGVLLGVYYDDGASLSRAFLIWHGRELDASILPF